MRLKRILQALAVVATAGMTSLQQTAAQVRGDGCEIGHGTCFALTPNHPAHPLVFFALIAILAGFLLACLGLAKARDKGIHLSDHGGHIGVFWRDGRVAGKERALIFGGLGLCILGIVAFAALFSTFGSYQ